MSANSTERSAAAPARPASARRLPARPAAAWRAACLGLLCWLAGLALPAQATIVYLGSTVGRNENLPLDGSPGAVIVPRPATAKPGDALIVSVAARPHGMTAVAPAGWILITFTDEINGGASTAPGGMSLVTYLKIIGVGEPASYTWTFANPSLDGGMAVGGLLHFSGIDTASRNPIDGNGTVWSAKVNASSLTQATTSISTLSTNTMIVSSITLLSATNFATPTGLAGLVERIDQSAPVSPNSVGMTMQMSTAPRAGAGATGAAQAVAANYADYGIGHLMALKPSAIDAAITMLRNGPISPGGSVSYGLTVSNEGLSTEPGPLTVVNTLPAALSYSAASGTGWVCGNSGQTVTCTRSGALAVGASAASLTISASVAANASGTVSNSATVSGTGGDANTDNNTAIDSFAIPTAPYAYYSLDGSSFATIADNSGNGRTAARLGSAAPTGASVGSPPGPALAGSPGSCGAADIPSGHSTDGINTAIDPNSLGNAGTISFWYSGNTSWNDGTDRILFDASNNLGGGDRHFFLAKSGSGSLVFSLKDSAGTVSTATTPNYGYTANEWHHITVSWNVATSSLTIYLDGTLAGSSATALNGTLGDTNTLYVGAQRSGSITGTPSGYTNNTSNGFIDEFRIYNVALSALEIESMPAYRHVCLSGIDHYEISLPSTGLSCLASSVTLTACADSSSPCTNKATTLVGYDATLGTSGGALAATVLTFNATGTASTTLSHALAANGAVANVTLSGEEALATNARKCCPNGSPCAAGSSCSITYTAAGFIIAGAVNGVAVTLPTQTAGTASSSYVLRAVKTNTTTKACEAALTSASSVNWATQCNNPTNCSAGNRLTLTGSSAVAIAGNPSSGVSSSTAVPMSFDANGNAPFSVNYADVGQITLYASKAASGSLAGPLAGNSNAFVVRPAALTVSAIQCTSYAAGSCATGAIASPGTNPAAGSASGSAFIPAGKAFTATVTAVDSGGNATPNFGQETAPETVRLSATLVQPTGGAAPALNNASSFGAFSGGAASGSSFNWPEVGIITLTPSLVDADYLGTGNVSGTASANVGRFIPHHFDVAVTAACGSFSYAGQAFAATLTARNGLLSPTTALNYDGSGALLPVYAKAVTLTDGGALGLGNLAGNSIAAAAFTAGVAAASPSYSFTSKSTAPQSLLLRATDSDGASSAGYTEASMPLRSGRLRVANAFGSARSALQLAAVAEYWSANAWVLNSADNCSTLAAGSVVLSNPRASSGAASAATSSASGLTLASGSGLLTLAAPSPAGSSLTLDLAINLGSSASDQSCNASHPASSGAAKPWLRSLNGSCAASADRDPAARASFGVYSAESRKTVHVREIF